MAELLLVDKKPSPPKIRKVIILIQVEREDFMRDARSFIDRARTEGPIEISDHGGPTRLVICVPTDRRPEFREDGEA